MHKYLLQPWGRLLRQPAFVICVIILGVCAFGLRVAAEKMKWRFHKESAFLRKPLDELDVTRLGSYKLLNAQKIPHEIEQELGTKDYIQWTLQDTSMRKGKPGAVVNLFITYYTGSPDKVPHVPDWCYVGSGGQIETRKNTTIRVPGLDGDAQQDSQEDLLPVRMLEINIPRGDGDDRLWVVYFFAVNGDFRCTRNEVRLRQNRLSDRYAYFSKVEISLSQSDKLGPDGTLAVVEKLAQTLLPVLMQEHWPDWEKLQGQEN